MPSLAPYESLLLNSNIQAFLQLIRKGEGTLDSIGYQKLFGGNTFNSFADHPNILVTKSGYKSTAAGAYQFLIATWRETKGSLGLPDFTPHSQDIGALKLIKDRGAIKDIIEGNVTKAIQKTNSIWASLPGSKYGQPTQKLNEAKAFYAAQGGTISSIDAQTSLQYVQAPGGGTTKTQTTDGGVVTDADGSTAAGNFDFSKIQNNLDVAEADNVFGTAWGARFNLQEDSNFIGLKQYLLYLTTRYYPQNLIPFVELIPVYTVDSATKSIVDKKLYSGNLPFYPSADGMVTKNELPEDPSGVPWEESSVLLDKERFDATSQKLSALATDGYTDLFTLDPFKETTDAFNTPNADGSEIQNRRGFGYKIFGNLTFSPALQGNNLSKAGAIGLKSIDIELGAQEHFGMSLITVKFVDVQGNKFLDINSPWSFILNSRPGTIGGDFYLRYGWQINIPDPKRKDDAQGKRFWNHPGWAGFGALQVGAGTNTSDEGDAIKRYIQNIAATCGNVLTLTQASTLSSMQTPGYMLDQKTGEFMVQRNLNTIDYDTLTLINPELAVDSQTGSIEATLYFRTNCGVANCLALLNGETETAGVKANETKALASKGTVTLTELMAAFVKDNMTFVKNTKLSGVPDTTPFKQGIFLAEKKFAVKDWLTVVGGAGTDSLIDADPDTIKIKIDNDDAKMINQSNSNDTRLLISWIVQVLSKNKCTLISAAGEKGAVSNGAPGSFIIAYDSDAAGEKKSVTTTNDLGKKDATYSDYKKYIDSNDTENFIGKRLQVQDDVFSFRFQGSLVESITVDKGGNTTQTTLDAIKAFSESQNQSTEVGPENKTSDPVTYGNKKRTLQLLYSQMAGLKVEAICHPWLKLCRPIFVKGLGFFDGKFMVIKISHKLDESNKFMSTINACKVLVTGAAEQKEVKLQEQQIVAMDKPGVGKSSPVGLITNNALKNVLKAPFKNFEGYGGGGFGGGGASGTFGTPIAPIRKELEDFIKQLHYTVQDIFRQFFKEFEDTNPQYKIVPSSGYRSFKKQAELFAANKNNGKPGESMHNYGLAVDLNIEGSSLHLGKYFWIQNGVQTGIANKNILTKQQEETLNNLWYSTGIIAIANRRGLTWGGNSFGDYKDRVHFGLDHKVDMGLLLSIAKQQFNCGENLALIIGNQVDFTGKTRA